MPHMGILRSIGRSDWILELNFTSRRTECLIGRAPTNCLVLQDPHISSRHARLRLANDTRGVLLDDISTNGTWLDNKQLSRGNAVPLEDGAEIRFPCNDDSRQDYTFVYSSESPKRANNCGPNQASIEPAEMPYDELNTGGVKAEENQPWAALDGLHDNIVREAARLAACVYANSELVDALCKSAIAAADEEHDALSNVAVANTPCASGLTTASQTRLNLDGKQCDGGTDGLLARDPQAEVERLRSIAHAMLGAMRNMSVRLRVHDDEPALTKDTLLQEFDKNIVQFERDLQYNE